MGKPLLGLILITRIRASRGSCNYPDGLSPRKESENLEKRRKNETPESIQNEKTKILPFNHFNRLQCIPLFSPSIVILSLLIKHTL